MLNNKWISWGLGALLALSACDEDTRAATALAVTVKHDLGGELTGLRVRVYQSNADFHNPATPVAGEVVIQTADLAKPIVINKGGAGEALVVVRGLNAANAEVVEYAVRARFQDGKTIAVPVFLAGVCKAKACAGTADTCAYEGDGCGSCKPVALIADDGREVTTPGAESAWTRGMCGGPVPPPAPAPCADAGTCEGGKGDGGTDADTGILVLDADTGTPCMLPPNWKPECHPSPLCGCDPGLGCTRVRADDPDSPQYSCEVRGDGGVNSRCELTRDCNVGNSCIFFAGVGLCQADCAGSSDCGAKGRCELTTNSGGKVIAASGTCRTTCTTASDCNGGCCLGGICFDDQYCRRDGIVCTSATNCAGSSGTKGGSCLTNQYVDGGAAPSTCYSRCNGPSDCASGCCYDNGNVAWCLEANELTAAQAAVYCVKK